MPANILADMNTLGASLEDQRALQIALELTKLGLNENDSSPPPSTANQAAFDRESEAAMIRKSANMTECVPVPSSEHVAEIVGRQGCKIKALRAKTNTYIKTPVRGEEPVFVVTGRKEDVCQAKREILSAAEHFSQIRASRRNNNGVTPGPGGATPGVLPSTTNPNLPGQVTIQVRVPYRVVGLVVGPKGATIKRIQQQTHTYIVTPNRDKEPIFEVTGLPENVDKARQEIEGHIAMRTGGMMDGNLNNHMNNLHSSMGNLNLMHSGGPPGSAGPPGSGGPPGSKGFESSDFHSNGIDAGFHEISNGMLFSSMYNQKSPNMTSAFTPYNKALNNNQSNNMLSQHHLTGRDSSNHHDNQVFTFPPHMDSGMHKFSECNPLSEGITNCSLGLYDSDEGIGGSPTFDGGAIQLASASIWSDLSSDSNGSDYGNLFSGMSSGSSASLPRHSMGLNSTAPCLSLPQLSLSSLGGSPGLVSDLSSHSDNRMLSGGLSADHPSVRRISSDPLNLATTLALLQSSASMGSSTVTAASVTSSLSLSESSTSSLHSGSTSSSPTEPAITSGPLAPQPQPPRGRNCLMCNDGDIVAALVPCGHNMFCMDCAHKLVHDGNGHCPICQQTPTQAIRIFS